MSVIYVPTIRLIYAAGARGAPHELTNDKPCFLLWSVVHPEPRARIVVCKFVRLNAYYNVIIIDVA